MGLTLYWHERRRCSRSPSGGRLATTLVDRYFHHYFFFFFPFFFFPFHSPSRPFLIEGVLGSKNLFSESCLKWPHYYREVISDFWFGGSKTRLPSPPRGKANKKLLWSKNLFCESCLKWPHYYREVISDFWFGECKLASVVLQAVRRCRRCGVAGAERVPPAPLGWYSKAL